MSRVPGRRFAALASFALTLALTLPSAPAVVQAQATAAPATSASASSPRGVRVDPELQSQLAANPAGVAAVVTTWSRDGLDQVAALGISGTRLQVLPMLLVRSLSQSQLDALRGLSAVRSVWANTAYTRYMEDTTWITRARATWAASTSGGPLPGLGITGRGVELAVIDTGADGKHEDMDNLVEFCETTQATSSDRSSVLCSPFRPESGNAGPAGPTNTARGDSQDDDGHGSHVSGTMAGTGHASGGMAFAHSTIGMAPEARLRVYSANVGPSLLNHEIMAAYDDLTFKRLKGLNRVVAVNNSWGGGDGSNYDPDDPLHVAIKAAYDAGILSVFAAGNSGPEHNTLSRQCVSPWVVCVAASTKPDTVVMFSSRGRPSQPADTNRDGRVDSADVPPDNHDRALGQAFEVGVYRPTLTAPGVNINAVSAGFPTNATCVEGSATPDSDCYVQLNGTSMATPHVTGAVGLIAEAYQKGHGGRLPTPAMITEILERSANLFKLPGYEAEEQGAGRLDAYEAARFAQSYPKGLPRPNLGAATPTYRPGAYPGGPASLVAEEQEEGCTGTGSWSARSVPSPTGMDTPPLSTQRYGQHVINVPEQTERLRITISWPRHPGANLYARLWRPGVNPDTDSATPDHAGRTPAYHQGRAFPDQEALGLVFVGTQRWLDIRAPEPSNPAERASALPASLPPGQWVLRVYHRAGGAGTVCGGVTQEEPRQLEGFRYSVRTEIARTTQAPSVQISSPAANAQITGRFAEIRGTASYPTPGEGVTTWEVPGSESGGSLIPDPDNRPVLYFHGNAGPHDSGQEDEVACTGDGRTDLIACGGPWLLPSSSLSPSPAASWKSGLSDELLDGSGPRTIYDPNWTWQLSQPTTIQGPMTLEWWASCSACSDEVGFSADWVVRVWADGARKFEQRITSTPPMPNVPARLVETVVLPPISASTAIVVHLDPVYVDSQTVTTIYYDSTQPCAAGASGPCDSLVRMPVGTSGGGGRAAGPANVRVTDLPARAPALRVAWDPADGTARYEVYRGTTPTFTLSRASRVYSGAGQACTSPVEAMPGEGRVGLCFTDTSVKLLTTYYYRVVAVAASGAASEASRLAYGTPTRYDRQVRVKADRLYGPGYWEFASLLREDGTQWRHVWDTLELAPGSHQVHARSNSQGIGSVKASRTYHVGSTAGGTSTTSSGGSTAVTGTAGGLVDTVVDTVSGVVDTVTGTVDAAADTVQGASDQATPSSPGSSPSTPSAPSVPVTPPALPVSPPAPTPPRLP